MKPKSFPRETLWLWVENAIASEEEEFLVRRGEESPMRNLETRSLIMVGNWGIYRM